MKKLFARHQEENEKKAKKALIVVMKRTISKNIIVQELLNRILSGAGTSEITPPSKKGKMVKKGQVPNGCLYCKVDKLAGLLAEGEAKVAQLANTWSMLFEEELDVQKLTNEACDEFYPLTVTKKVIDSKEEAGDFLSEALGINPADYESFSDFMDAVAAKGAKVTKMSFKKEPKEEAEVETAAFKVDKKDLKKPNTSSDKEELLN